MGGTWPAPSSPSVGKKRPGADGTHGRPRSWPVRVEASIARGIRSVVKTGGRSDQVGVRVSTNAAATLPPEHRSLPRLLDKGKWRHPLFGDRERWYAQATTRAGWFERVALTHQPTATRRIHGVLMDFTDELARRIEVGKRIT